MAGWVTLTPDAPRISKGGHCNEMATQPQFSLPKHKRNRLELNLELMIAMQERGFVRPGKLVIPHVGHDDDCSIQHGGDSCECAVLVSVEFWQDSE